MADVIPGVINTMTPSLSPHQAWILTIRRWLNSRGDRRQAPAILSSTISKFKGRNRYDVMIATYTSIMSFNLVSCVLFSLFITISSPEFSLYVGELTVEVTDTMLLNFFAIKFPAVKEAKGRCWKGISGTGAQDLFLTVFFCVYVCCLCVVCGLVFFH